MKPKEKEKNYKNPLLRFRWILRNRHRKWKSILQSRIRCMKRHFFLVTIKTHPNMPWIRQHGIESPGLSPKTEYLKSVWEKTSNADHSPIASTGRWKPYGEPARITLFELQSEKRTLSRCAVASHVSWQSLAWGLEMRTNTGGTASTAIAL